jgi:hypothetical protein
MINGDDQRRTAQRVDFRGQLRQLRTGFEIARKQDHAADQRMLQPLPVFTGQGRSRHIQHHRPQGYRFVHISSTTQAQARLDSSLMVR